MGEQLNFRGESTMNDPRTHWKSGKIWIKIKDLIRSKSNNSENYDEKYVKIRLNLDSDLRLNKTFQFYGMIIVVRSVFDEDSKYFG